MARPKRRSLVAALAFVATFLSVRAEVRACSITTAWGVLSNSVINSAGSPTHMSKVHEIYECVDGTDCPIFAGHRTIWIVGGSGLPGTDSADIVTYDETSGGITKRFELPDGTDGCSNAHIAGEPYWRTLIPFGGAMYFGLGDNHPSNNQDKGNGQVWRTTDGTTFTQVLNLCESDTYSLAVGPDSTLYAGLGTEPGGTAKLYNSSTGNSGSWSNLKTWSGSTNVRTLVTWTDPVDGFAKLMIGLKVTADFWSYRPATTTFTSIGAPPGVGAQVKSLVVGPDGFIYAGCVNAEIDIWNGSAWKQSVSLSGPESEVYKGEGNYDGCVFFPTNANGAGIGGRIYKLQPGGGTYGGCWNTDFANDNPILSSQIQVVKAINGFAYAIGGKKTSGLTQPLQLFRTQQ